jgi:hypothetical protein
MLIKSTLAKSKKENKGSPHLRTRFGNMPARQPAIVNLLEFGKGFTFVNKQHHHEKINLTPHALPAVCRRERTSRQPQPQVV